MLGAEGPVGVGRAAGGGAEVSDGRPVNRPARLSHARSLKFKRSSIREGGPVRSALDDARRLRQVARTLRPGRAQVDEAGAALTEGVAQIIREVKWAA